MQILLAGSSGFIGSYLLSSFTKRGDVVVSLSRKDFLLDTQLLAKKLEGIDVVINLVGESIFSFWTKKKKQRILQSRLFATEKLVEAMKLLSVKPQVFLSASGIGIYKETESPVSEEGEKGSSFLAFVCKEWEKKAEEAKNLGIRTLFIRFGTVLGKGGFLQKASFPARWGLFPILGKGNQFFSWIDIEDLFLAICFVIKNPSLEGPINFCSPFFLTQKRVAADINGGRTFLRIPSFFISLAFKEMGEELLLKGQKVSPEKLVREEFLFKTPRFIDSLKKHGIGKWKKK